MTRVIVHIDALRLTGFGHDSSRAVAEGLRQELASALGAAGVAQALASGHGPVARLRVAPVRLAHNATSHRVGSLVARSVASGITS